MFLGEAQALLKLPKTQLNMDVVADDQQSPPSPPDFAPSPAQAPGMSVSRSRSSPCINSGFLTREKPNSLHIEPSSITVDGCCMINLGIDRHMEATMQGHEANQTTPVRSSEWRLIRPTVAAT